MKEKKIEWAYYGYGNIITLHGTVQQYRIFMKQSDDFRRQHHGVLTTKGILAIAEKYGIDAISKETIPREDVDKTVHQFIEAIRKVFERFEE